MYVCVYGLLGKRGNAEGQKGRATHECCTTVLHWVMSNTLGHLVIKHSATTYVVLLVAMNHVRGNVLKNDVVWTLCLSSCVRFVGAGDRVFQV